MHKRFADKSVVVTGAAQGIGKACALRLAAEGARILIADKAEDAAQNVAEEIGRAGGQADVFVADLSKSQCVKDLMATAKQRFGRIDVSVHNVGGAIRAKPFWEFTEDQIEEEICQSFWPTLWCCRFVLPYLIEQRSGVIVNIGSVATRGIYRVPYSAAKGGVQALTTCIALETAQYGIRVNCVAPGGTEVRDRTVERPSGQLTSADKAGIEGVIRQTLQDTPLGRFGTVEEQASVVAFLASEDASYLTGQTLYAAGGGVG